MRIRIEGQPDEIREAAKKIQAAMGPLVESDVVPVWTGERSRIYLDTPRIRKKAGCIKRPYPLNWAWYYERWKTKDVSGREIIEELGISQGAFYSMVKEWEAGIVRPDPQSLSYPKNWDKLWVQWRAGEISISEFIKLSGVRRRDIFEHLFYNYQPPEDENGDDQN